MRTLLLALLALSLLSCGGSGPQVDVCLVYPEKAGLICVDTAQKPYYLSYAAADKYVAFSPSDAEKLIEAAGLSGHQRAAVRNYFRTVQQVASNTQ